MLIPKKRGVVGRRFGFVRYGKIHDARRAIERLDDFMMLNHRLGVNMVRFQGRTTFWRRKAQNVKKEEVHRQQIEGQDGDMCNTPLPDLQGVTFVVGETMIGLHLIKNHWTFEYK